jgi:hypothetical protein
MKREVINISIILTAVSEQHANYNITIRYSCAKLRKQSVMRPMPKVVV